MIHLAKLHPDWLNGSIDMCASSELPEGRGPVGASFVFVTSGSKAVFVDVDVRGWDLPGGHVEPGESAVDAAVRELREEASLVVTSEQLRVVGFGAIVAPGQWESSGGRYPDEALLAFYAVDLPARVKVAAGFETMDAAWFSLSSSREVCGDRVWLPLLDHLHV